MAPTTLVFLLHVLVLCTSSSSSLPSTAAALPHHHHHPLSLNSSSSLLLTSPAAQDPAPPVPAEYRVYIILLKPHKEGATLDAAARRVWQSSFLPPGEFTAHGEPRVLYWYDAVFDGFAARLTAEELEPVSRKPGFGRWFPGDGIMQLHTTRTPAFLGLSKGEGLWAQSSYGKGVIVGVVDSGVTAFHPSFKDDGMPPPPETWKGSCSGWWGVRCNNKLIGVHSYVDNDPGHDDVGHGTATASIAVGNFVGDADSMSSHQAAGTAAGTAPGAHLAVYKACNCRGQCSAPAIIDAINAAISDGVDVLNLSLGHGVRRRPRLQDDIVAIATFRAVASGVVVVYSAGNDGPAWSSVENEDNAGSTSFTIGEGLRASYLPGLRKPRRRKPKHRHRRR